MAGAPQAYRACGGAAMVALMTRGTDETTREDDRRWRAVLDADRSLDGAFVTAVRTTRIYCRPSCPARKPKRENVEFFATPDGAERAGYRACKRCRPREAADPQRELVGRICERLIEGDGTAPYAERTRRGVPRQPVPPAAHVQAHHRRDAAPVPRRRIASASSNRNCAHRTASRARCIARGSGPAAACTNRVAACWA